MVRDGGDRPGIKPCGAATRMVRDYLLLLSCQAAGDIVHQVTRLALSGPIIGMVLLLALLSARGGPSPELRQSATSLLGYISLFFVPAGVGVVRQLPLIEAHWLALLAAVVVSTALAMVSGALAMQSVNRLIRRHRMGAAALIRTGHGDD
jgi:holin-like protein